MDVAAVYAELYGRIPPLVRDVVDGLSGEQLCARLAEHANPIGWLVWHLTRVQDDHVGEVMGVPQLWASDPRWAASVGLDPDPSNTGYGHAARDVAGVRPESAVALVAYHDAVAARSEAWLATLAAGDLDRVVDTSWDPPVTLGVRLVSVADDSLQHLGQAAYLRGLMLR